MYRSRCWLPKAYSVAFFEIYKIVTLLHRSCKSALIHRLFCTQPVYHYGKYRYPQAEVLGARIAVSDAVLSSEARRSRGTVRSDASLARGGELKRFIGRREIKLTHWWSFLAR